MSDQIPLAIATAVIGLLTSFADANDELPDTVRQILEHNCLKCHNDQDRKGDFSLQSAAGLKATSHLEPGDARNSQLYQVLVAPAGQRPKMPPQGTTLTAAEAETIRTWIQSGAAWPESARLKEPRVDRFDWWSLQPLSRPPIPIVPPEDSKWIRTPIDAFILRKLRASGLSPTPEADRRTLIRRLSYDLTGLPPTPQEIDAFVADSDSSAYENMVDKLLASPHAGEHWGRRWLDVVRYADTCGYDKDKLRPNAWPYRDYVIRAFNDDKPYARFVEEQIAGDVLFPGTPDGILGLGFIAAGPWDFIGHVEVSESKLDGQEARNLDRDEMVSATINTFCSTTVQCARCHHHKFDPISQEQYYGLQTVFAAVDRADRVYDIDPNVETRRAALEEQLAGIKASLNEISERVGREQLISDQKRLEKQRADLPAGLLVYAAATEFRPQGQFKPTNGTPRPVRVLHRGNLNQPLDAAVPGTIGLAPDAAWKFSLPENHSEGERRAALARWISDRENPLTWRSIANRLWLFSMGRGLVDSPNDFGRMGQLPTHPELLDWLAVEFRDNGQSFRSLIRLIVTSSTYRQASSSSEVAERVDQSNQLHWRKDRRRLTAEEVRDSMLAVSGRLDRTLGGPAFQAFILEKPEHSPHYEYNSFDPADPKSHRRSVYRFVVRSQPDPLMTVLDCADSSQSMPRREATLTALQALSLLNSRFTLQMAQDFAARLQREDPDLSIQVKRGFSLATGREPSQTEGRALEDYARQHGLPSLCRVLLNLSEFLYVD